MLSCIQLNSSCLPTYLTCLLAYMPTSLPAYLPSCLPTDLPNLLPASVELIQIHLLILIQICHIGIIKILQTCISKNLLEMVCKKYQICHLKLDIVTRCAKSNDVCSKSYRLQNKSRDFYEILDFSSLGRP